MEGSNPLQLPQDDSARRQDGEMPLTEMRQPFSPNPEPAPTSSPLNPPQPPPQEEAFEDEEDDEVAEEDE